jgi:hypothetical protein
MSGKNKHKITEKEYHKEARIASGKLSALARWLSFGGLAGVWLLWAAGHPNISVRAANITAIIFMLFFLAEAGHYWLQSESLRRLARALELSGENASDGHSPVWVSWTWRLWRAKLIICALGWLFLLSVMTGLF